MTALELSKVLQDAIDAGQGDAEVLFDSEAQHFCVHMVSICSAFIEPAELSPNGKAFISLHYAWEGHIQRCDK